MKSSEIVTTQGFVEHIKVSRIHGSGSPLRSELGALDELALSIMKNGLLSPIVVRQTDDLFFEVVAGNRRLEACKRLDIKMIPCYVAEFDDKEAYEASLVENVQRKTLNPLEEAKAFKKYVDDLGYGSESDLARQIGKSPSYVSRRISLLKLPEKTQEQILRSAKVGMAQEILPLVDDEQIAEVITELVVEGKVATSSELRHIVSDMTKSCCNRTDIPKQLVPRKRSEFDCKQEQEESDKSLFSYRFSMQEVRQHVLDRAFSKYIASLRLCMTRMDEVLDSLDENEEWVVRETLMQYRKSIHGQIDSLIRLKKKKTATSRFLPRLHA
ncbi:MAG: ParB/RepB/Spo0J family partition protein [Nitrososphaerota archaeon]|nr:ParB/RepB/Spo0J family partition protein [Nitrososphaerota archaeon]